MSQAHSRAQQAIAARPYQSNPPTAPPPKSPPPTRRRLPKGYFVVGGVFIYGITAYSYSYFSALRQSPSDHGLPTQDADVSPTYDTTAHSFDNCVGLSEFLGGINRQRRKLAQQAKGHVLEASVGTGRNFKYYNLDYTWKDWSANSRYVELLRRKNEHEARKKAISSESPANVQAVPELDIDVPAVSPWVESRSKAPAPTRGDLIKKSKLVRSLTFIDLSAPMISIAREKFSHKYPGYRPVQFLTQSALAPLHPSPITNAVRQHGGYDYIIQSMGLCSTPEPVQLLKQLGELAHPQRGRILLLEHGRSHWGWMNRYMDSTASRHAKRHGCWYNRDIGKIVEESGLVVERCKRKHFGTLWVVEARPRREGDEKKEIKLSESGTLALEKGPIAEERSDVRSDSIEQSEATKPTGPALTDRAWSSIKSLTGMDEMKKEDPGLEQNTSKKND